MNMNTSGLADTITGTPANREPVLSRWPVFMLFSRVLIFVLFGLLFAWILHLSGSAEPFAAVVKWWPFQVICANAVCFLLLKWLCGREGKSFFSLFKYDRKQTGRDIKAFLLLLVISGAVGYFGVYGATLLVYNNVPPVNISQPLPVWALILAAVLFPASNALIETTTYFGYSYERLKGRGGSWLPILIPVFFLALQHVAIPLYFDVTYLLWRLLSFLPMALVVGLFYYKLQRLSPIVLAHFLADWSTLVLILLAV